MIYCSGSSSIDLAAAKTRTPSVQVAGSSGGGIAATFLLPPLRASHWPDHGAGAIPEKGGAKLRDYELMVIFKPDLEDQALQEAVERLNGLIAARNGQISSSDVWGRRRLAYPIQDFRDGIYTVTQLKLDPNGTDELERSLKLNDQIIRYLLIRVD